MVETWKCGTLSDTDAARVMSAHMNRRIWRQVEETFQASSTNESTVETPTSTTVPGSG